MPHGEPEVEQGLPVLQRIARHSFTPRELFALDVIAATLLLLLTGLGGPHKTPRLSGSRAGDLDISIDALAVIAVLCRRRYPRVTFAGLLAVTLVALALRADGPAPLYLALVLYSCVGVSTRRTGLWTVAGATAASIGCVVIGGGDLEASSVTGITATLLLGWMAAEYVRTNRRYAEYLAERRAERAAEAEASEADRIERAIAGERVKIARDLHDIVAHAMSVIAVRSGVARMVIDTQPEEAREALAIIETTTRRTLQEMRLLVGVLRDTNETGAELGPAPGMDDLGRLKGEIELAGVSVDLDVAGTPRSLPAATDLSAYRIIQEALTNVVRHAGPTSARVQITYLAEAIGIDVRDDGPAPGAGPGQPVARQGEGHGIIGMRERTALFGGTLVAGPSHGGFRIQASLRTDE